MQAVKQWRFRPYYLSGEPVETQARITVNFTISTN
jgi:outer membrane biosynthesis protein TonB